MTVIVYYNDGAVGAEDCHSFYVQSDGFMLDHHKNDISKVSKILVDGTEVYDYATLNKAFDGFNEFLYRYMVSYWNKSGKPVVPRSKVSFDTTYNEPRRPEEYPFSVNVDGKYQYWIVPREIIVEGLR